MNVNSNTSLVSVSNINNVRTNNNSKLSGTQINFNHTLALNKSKKHLNSRNEGAKTQK